MGFLLTPEYCERSGRGQATSPQPCLLILYAFVCVQQAGGSSVCGCGASSVAGDPSPRRRGPARTRPAVPGSKSEGRRRGRGRGKRVGERKLGERGRCAAARRRGAGIPRVPRRSPASCRWSPPRQPIPQPQALPLLPRGLLPGPEGAGVGALGARPPSRSCAWRLASPMAEGRRWEDEEEELGRRARGRALSGHSAAGEGREEQEAGG